MDYQRSLFPYAYNILGTIEDAKDIVQDVLAGYFSRENPHVQHENSYLTKAVINRAITQKKKNDKFERAKNWLPEPVSTVTTDATIVAKELLSYSLLVLLEQLSVKERAVFILKEAFDYSHKEIADSIAITIENSRKLLSRARTKLKYFKEEQQTDSNLSLPLYMERYINVIKNGELASLEKMLSDEIALVADGGKDINVVRAFTFGVKQASKLLLYVYKTFQTGHKVVVGQVNHQPALLFYKDNVLFNCQVFEFHQGKIKRLFSVIDPDKLGLII